MKAWIKTSLVAVLAATTLASGAAMAQCDWHGWHGDGHRAGWGNATPQQVKERMNEQVELQMARLELALALTPEQEPAWADFKKVAQARSEAMLKKMESRRSAEPPKTAIERLARAEEHSKEHTTMLAEARKATETFYGKLSAAQKTVFDGEATNFIGGCGMGKPGYGPGKGSGKKGGKRAKR